MLTTNPFAILAETIPMIAIQSFVIIMVGLVILGTVLDMIHKKNVKYFFNNAKKAKKSAKKELLHTFQGHVLIFFNPNQAQLWFQYHELLFCQ